MSGAPLGGEPWGDETQVSIFRLRSRQAIEWYGLAADGLIQALDESLIPS